MDGGLSSDETLWRQKIAALQALPWSLQLRIIVCLVMFSIEVVFVASDAALALVGSEKSIQGGLLLTLLLDKLAETDAFVLFWKGYHYIYLASVSLYVSTIYRVSSHHLRRSRNRMAAINKSSAVVKLAADGRFIEVNDVFCAILRHPPGSLIGRHHRTVVPDHLSGNREYEAFWKQLRSGQMVTGLFERIDADGSPVWVRGTYHPIKGSNGEVYEILKIASDETERVKAQVDLKSANTYLEHAAKILRHDMHSGINTYMPRAVKSLDRRLSKMPEVQEKLKMPMRLLRAGLEHTQGVYKGVREFTTMVRQGVEMDRSDHDLQEILVSYLSGTVYDSMVTVEPLVVAPVNRSLFCTAIDNFIRNGLAYNDSHTKHVTVKMESEQLVIIDNGRGMSQEDFEMYSKPYVRKEGQVESGSGLGLNISIAILQEHGFILSCEKRTDGGTTIKVRLS